VKNAFTMAEILITLGIIGVVAALTIPGLITNYQKKITVARLKESYAIMQQAIKLSVEENGEISTWDTTLYGSQFFHKYFANYIKYTKEYSTSELNKITTRKLLNGKNYYGTTYTNVTASHFVLINGTMISMNMHSTLDKEIWVGVDVNGITLPNKIGRDTFLFMLSSEYGLVPFGAPGTSSTQAHWNYGTYSRTKILSNTKAACNKNTSSDSGYWCTALIMHDGWKIANDYPW